MSVPNCWDGIKVKVLTLLMDGIDHTFPEVMTAVAEDIPEEFAVRTHSRSSKTAVREVPLDYRVWAGRRVLICRWLSELVGKGWVFCDDAPLDQRTVRMTRQGLEEASTVSRKTLLLLKARELLAKQNGKPNGGEPT
jgi:hypothetical protein